MRKAITNSSASPPPSCIATFFPAAKYRPLYKPTGNRAAVKKDADSKEGFRFICAPSSPKYQMKNTKVGRIVPVPVEIGEAGASG